MTPKNPALKLNKETLRQLQEEQMLDVHAGKGTLATCRIVSCALPCQTANCTFQCTKI